MASDIKIARLDMLLEPHLAANEVITDYRTKPHTAVGENFGSLMVTLDVDIANKETGHKRTLHLVNKMIPVDPYVRDIFNTKITYFKEMDFYLKAVPAMLKLQQDCGTPEEDWVSNIFPRCYGARPGFGDQVDSDAAILLENLNTRGFTLRDKKAGLNLKHSRLVMEKLAYLHALPIAMKKNHPADYEASIKAAAKFFVMNEDGKDREEMSLKFSELSEKVVRKLAIKPEIIEAMIETTKGLSFSSFPEPVEPFVTISHEDLWVNNVLFRPGTDDGPAALAFVDFQTTRPLSPMLDFVFFLYTSVTASVRREHFDELFDVYYDSFCRCLRQVNCDSSEFTKAAFKAEMSRVAGIKLLDVVARLRIITLREEDLVDEDWFHNVDLGGEEYLERLKDVVLDFYGRGWLKK